MLTIHLDTAKLSVDELSNLSRVLRCRCSECIEDGIAEAGRHGDEIGRFLDGLATAIDRDRDVRARREAELPHQPDATGVP